MITGRSNAILDIGFPTEECFHCGAIMWKYERTKQQDRINSWGFSLCCGEGKVELPKLRETPVELKNLLDGSDQLSKSFCTNSRMFNSVFASTSTGGKIDNRFNHGGGPFVYRVYGELYHQIGSLFTEDDDPKAVYSQIYMLDNQEALQSRINFPHDDKPLDNRIIEPL